MAIHLMIDRVPAQRDMSADDFADPIGITPANDAALKNGRAKAVRFSPLDAFRRVLECRAGDMLHHELHHEG